MDWNKVRNSPGATAGMRLELVEMCWRMRSLRKSTRILSCAIYRSDAPGVEVRAGYSDEDLLRSQRTTEIDSAREVADAWAAGGHREGGISARRGRS